MNKTLHIFPIGIFVCIWAIISVVLLLLPIQSKFHNVIDIIFLHGSFIIIVTLWSVCLSCFLPYSKNVSVMQMKIAKYNFIFNFSTFASPLGLILVIYDRIFIRGIDYSYGLREARYQWLELGDIGSIWGKLGNLLIPFSYCILFMGVFHWESNTTIKKCLTILIGLGVPSSFAMVNGGRSNILVAMIFLFVICIIRKTQKKTFFPKVCSKITLVMVSLCIISGILGYVSSIIYTYSDNTIEYLEVAADVLGAKIVADYHSHNNVFINTITHIVLYLFHGIYYSGAVIEYMPQPATLSQNISLRIICDILTRLGILDWTLELPVFDGGAGNFISLPGILLYDYGYIGFVIASILLGILNGLAVNILYSQQNISIIKLVSCIVMFMILYMSPVTLCIGLGYFIFMVYALLMMELIAGIFYGFSGWTQLRH